MTTREYIESALIKQYTNVFKHRKELIDTFIEFFGEDRIYVPVNNDVLIENCINYCYNLNGSILDRAFTDIPIGALSVDILQDYLFESVTSAIKTQPIFTTNIYIYYPQITLENENHLKHTIQDVFIKVTLKGEHIHDFSINRTTYTEAEMAAGYCHSHSPSKDFSISSWYTFKSMCLGTGPLVTTLNTLRSQPFDIAFVGLFCQELDNYLRVESLTGVPYIKMSSLSSSTSSHTTTALSEVVIDTITLRWVQTNLTVYLKDIIKVLRFNISNGQVKVAMPYVELLKKVSKVIQEKDPIVFKSKAVNCVFPSTLECSISTHNNERASRTIPKTPIIIFNGVKYYGKKIIDSSDNSQLILHPNIIKHIVFYINYKLNEYSYSKALPLNS